MKAAGSLPVLAISRREERFDDPHHHNRFDIGLIVLLLRIEQIAIAPSGHCRRSIDRMWWQMIGG
jgi:hypothetical protein